MDVLYQPFEEEGLEAEAVEDFREKFITAEDAENKFHIAIRETGFIGFKAGFSAAMSLFAEASR